MELFEWCELFVLEKGLHPQLRQVARAARLTLAEALAQCQEEAGLHVNRRTGTEGQREVRVNVRLFSAVQCRYRSNGRIRGEVHFSRPVTIVQARRKVDQLIVTSPTPTLMEARLIEWVRPS